MRIEFGDGAPDHHPYGEELEGGWCSRRAAA